MWLAGEATPKIFRITVGRAAGIAEEDEKLRQLLAELFPDSDVMLTDRQGKLVVDGLAKDQQEAVEILSVIRSVRLIPVVDQLQTR